MSDGLSLEYMKHSHAKLVKSRKLRLGPKDPFISTS